MPVLFVGDVQIVSPFSGGLTEQNKNILCAQRQVVGGWDGQLEKSRVAYLGSVRRHDLLGDGLASGPSPALGAVAPATKSRNGELGCAGQHLC